MTEKADNLTELIAPLQRLARILAPTPDQAQDMAQEALLRVWDRLQSGQDIAELRPYLMTTLRNARFRQPRQDQELTEHNTPSQPAEIWPRFACADVMQAMESLSEEQALLLHLVALHHKSYAQLAREMDLPIGTVMSRISRARARLRRNLDLPRNRAVETLLQDETG